MAASSDNTSNATCAEPGSTLHAQRTAAALDWHKSSYSDSSGGQCVEVATTPATVHVRDSKIPDGPNLHIPADAWVDFLAFATRYR
ncbi:DUF397 domain-containing protein [Streptomyces milbemycinicus]|uniref:DUF397 domain-containing protein n=1 Tax=Streptomyces milbemycinicus TaxID=476552 RepID=UPI0033E09031